MSTRTREVPTKLATPFHRASRPLANRIALVPAALGGAVVLLGLCTCASSARVRPDDMSAAAHREAATHEAAAAAREGRAYDPGATEVRELILPRRDLDVPEVDRTYNPTAWHLTQAARESAHAREHAAAAAALDAFEAQECSGFAAGVRSACPLMAPIVRRDLLPDGVRLEFAPGTDVDSVVTHMRCHLAYARDRGFPGALACPLYLKGVAIRRSQGGGGVEITGTGRALVAEIQRLSGMIAKAGAEAPALP